MKRGTALILIVGCFLGAVPGTGSAASPSKESGTLTAPLVRGDMNTRWSDFASAEGVQVSFADSLAAITDKASMDLFGKPVDQSAMRRYLSELAWKVRGRITDGDARKTAEVFAQVLFDEERFVGDEDEAASADPATAILSSVIQNKRGVCLSLSLIYLAVADEATIPLHGVSVPTHFFVRYEDDRDRLNIETLRRGIVSNSDAFYRKKFFVRKGEPFYLMNLERKEALATYVSQLAAIYSRLKKFDQAVELLEVARRASPTDPEIRTNLGVALEGLGRPDDSLRAFWSAIVLDPYDDVAHHHLARGLADRGDWLPAIYHLDESMRLGHALDIKLIRRLEPHRPDAIRARSQLTPASPSPKVS